MSFEVRWSASALDDLDRLSEFLLQRASTVEDLELAGRAIDAIRDASHSLLARYPYSFRKAASNARWRELIIPFGSTGYVARYKIQRDRQRVIVLAVRHQREEDYH